MVNIIFLSYVVPKDQASSYSGVSIAGNKMQWNIAHNLSVFSDVSFHCLSIIPIAPFPRDKRILVKKEILKIDDYNSSLAIRFINIPIIKQFSQIHNVFTEAKHLVSKCDGERTIVIGFNLFPQIGIPLRWLKKKNKSLETLSILADLPIDDKTHRGFFSKIFRQLFDRSTKKSIRMCDHFVVLNDFVGKNYLNGKKYIVIDGGIDLEEYEEAVFSNSNSVCKKNVVFSGALTAYNGINTLLSAFELLQGNEFSLEIYGDGYLKDAVISSAKKDYRIKYKGKVSNEEMLIIQKQAWLLINPRVINDPISKVTFPSKTFEYLLSGRPVLTTKLLAYSAEYSDLMFFCDDSPESIAREIERISNLPQSEITSKTDKALKYMLENKTWEAQTYRIKKFIDSCFS